MKENQRKCLKCGRSPAIDSKVKLFRFPRPGTTNTLRCELWAKYCFPDKPCTTELKKKLYSEHHMLCDHHFKPESNDSANADFTKKKLHRSASPEDVKRLVVEIPTCSGSSMSVEHASNKISSAINQVDMSASPLQSVLKDTTNLIELQKGISNKIVSQKCDKAVEVVTPTTSASTQHVTDKEKYYMAKCRKSIQKICKLRNKIKKLTNDEVLKALENDENVMYLSKRITPTLALLLQGEIKNFKRKEKGRRWTQEQKITALRIYKRSPTCYNLLRRLLLLPSTSTLKKLLQQFNLKVGINKKKFEMLKKFTDSQDPKNNEYVLLFDEMAIKKHLAYSNKNKKIEGYQDHDQQGRSSQVATYALVFMICGIRKQLKQPVAFYLSGSSVTADRLAVLIKEILHQCFQANINISATVCDMDGVNKRALGILGATAQNPQFEINNHSIVSLFDPPHLLKCFRNLFLKYNIKHLSNITSENKIGEGIAKWSHIKQFYEIDNNNPNFVFAPKLKAEHLNPNNKQKMKVKLAAQVLSHSVAAGMYCKVAQGELPNEAVVTADLIANMDNLFDCLNSDRPDQRGGKCHSTNMTEKTPHLALFKKMKFFFENIQFIGCRSRPPSIEGWVWTLNGMEMLWNNLKKRNPKIRSLSTRKLQQDPLENLFGCIRGNCGSNTNPTSGQFVAALKTAVLSRLASAGVQGTNCEKDKNDAILNNLKNLLYQKNNDDKEIEENTEVPMYQEFHTLPEDNEVDGEIQACAYVSGFILKNVNNQCGQCIKDLIATDHTLEHLFIEMKEYDSSKPSLKYGSVNFIKSIELCSKLVNLFLEKNSYIDSIKSECLKTLNTTYFEFLKCKTHREKIINYIKESVFLICIKRFCIVQNRKFAEASSVVALQKKIKILKHM